MKLIKKTLAFLAIVLLYFVFKEMVLLLSFAFDLSTFFGYFIVVLLLAFITYFILWPIISILRLPQIRGPVEKKDKEEKLINERLVLYKHNEYLQNNHPEILNNLSDSKDYKNVIEILKKQSSAIRRKSMFKVFAASAVSQNGFIDAVIILLSNVEVVLKTFKLFNGRSPIRHLIKIGKLIGVSIGIGGSGGIEAVTKFVVRMAKGLPILGTIFGSLSDGGVNAMLLARVSIITENYCTKTYLEKKDDLFPESERLKESVTNAHRIFKSNQEKTYGLEVT